MKKLQTSYAVALVAFSDTKKLVFVNAYVQMRDGYEVHVRSHWRGLPRRQSLH